MFDGELRTSAVSPSGEALPAGPTTSGVVQTARWMFRPIPLMEGYRRRYGPVFSMRLGPADVVMIADPELARKALAGDPDLFHAGDTNGVFTPVVGSHSILVLDGSEHLQHRKIMLPAFGAGHGAGFADQVREITERRVSSWRVGEEIRLQSEMEQISFESIMRIVFGVDGGEDLERLRPLIPEMMDRCDSAFTLIPWFRKRLAGLSPYARLMQVLDAIDEVLYEAIAERRLDPLTQMRSDVLSLLIRATDEAGRPLPDRHIRDELLTMLMAGYETTSSGLAWAFERLLHTPNRLETLVDRLGKGDERYLDAVVHETLRSRPVVPVVARRLTKPARVGGHFLPEGTVLMVSIYLVHRDEATYPDPDEFRPERFLEGIPAGAAWIPFGGGVRRCMGASFAQLEMKCVLQEVLMSVRLRAANTAPEPAKRKRFTFTPGSGAKAIVAAELPSETKLGRKRFRTPPQRTLTSR